MLVSLSAGNRTHDLCEPPESFLHISSFHPLTHSRSHTLRLDCTHLLYMCVAGCTPLHTHATGKRSSEGEINQSLLLILQEHVHLKQKDKRGVCALNRTVRQSRLFVSEEAVSHARWPTPRTPSPLAPNGWRTAVLHWQALCSCTHAKAASWRTALVSPAPDDSRIGNGWGLVGRSQRKATLHTLCSQTGH